MSMNIPIPMNICMEHLRIAMSIPTDIPIPMSIPAAPGSMSIPTTG